MVEEKLGEIIRVISGMFDIDVSHWSERSPFEMLVGVILSQKTNWRNVRRALERFRKRFKSVEDVAEARIREIEFVIRPAGLYREKARRIKEIARQLSQMAGGLEGVLKLPYPEAKKLLSSMRGIGPKTADVFLMAVRREKVLPIDTHIFRIMRRLGVADEKDDYESLRAKLEEAVPPEERMRAHLALIEFGREICKARNPRCGNCPISQYCPSMSRPAHR